MAVFTDARLVAVLATYESGVDRVLQQVRDTRTGPADQGGSAPGGGPGGNAPWVVTRLRGRTYPGHPDWPTEPPERRAAWWVRRISLWAAGPTALPWVAGRLSDRLPVKDALSAAAQGLVVCAVSREYGVDDADRRISLLAEVLTGRRIEPAAITKLRAARTDVQPAAGALPAEFDREVDEAVAEPRRGVVRRAGRALWGLARVVGEMGDLLDGRQKGHVAARALGVLPVVGVIGGYFAEHGGLKRAGRKTEQLLSHRCGIVTARA